MFKWTNKDDVLAAFDAAIVPDDERRALIDDSDDWDLIIQPAMKSWGAALDLYLASGNQIAVITLIPGLRVLTESIYVRGYRRGKEEE